MIEYVVRFERGRVESGGVGRGSKRPSFRPQCERETGRASQADVTPYGVGGFFNLTAIRMTLKSLQAILGRPWINLGSTPDKPWMKVG